MPNTVDRVVERRFAITLANKVLENTALDPDGDLSVLARQFLRETERFAYVQAAEREACALLAEQHTGMWDNATAEQIAKSIRERGSESER